MPLSLNVPDLEDKPLIQADTHPQKISQFIDSLPPASVLEAGAALQVEIQMLNRQRIAPDIRVKALETYRPTLINITETLATQYCSALLPLPESAQQHAALAESLWLELAYGYKLALIDQQNKLFSLSGSKSTAVMIQRAIEAMGQLAMVYYQTYRLLPESIWTDLHQLYRFAVQNSLQDVGFPGGKETRGTTSVSLTYKQVLLMSLTDPQHLSAHEMKQIAAYIDRHAHHAQLQGLARLENPAGIFLVKLDEDKPAAPYQKKAGNAATSSEILLVTIELARLAYKHLQILQNGNVPTKGELPDNASEPRYQDILTYLIKRWGSPPKRIFNRLRDSDSVELGIGINSAHYFMNGGKPFVAPVNDVTEVSARVATPRSLSEQTYKPSQWQALNISAGGMALRKLPHTEGSVRIGELLSVKNRFTSNWSVGVLRWANSNEHQQLDIGAQLIAPEATAAGARIPNQTDFEPILLLPPIPPLKQAASIIAACGMYGPARVLQLAEGGKISRVMITKLIERTGSFERFQFSHLT